MSQSNEPSSSSSSDESGDDESMLSSSSSGSESEVSVTLTCSCKRGKCHVCGACKRCGCEHDGVPLAQKLARKRGRPKLNVEQKKENRIRRRKSRKTSSETSSSNSNRMQLTETLKAEDAHAFARFLEMSKHSLPSTEKRVNGTCSNEEYLCIRRYLKDATKAIAGALFPAYKEKLVAELFDEKESINAEIHREHESMTQDLAVAYNTSLRGSQVKLLARAVLVRSMARQTLLDYGVEIGSKSFAAGRVSWNSFVASGRFLVGDRTTVRYSPQNAAFAVNFVLSEDCIKYLSWESKQYFVGDTVQNSEAIIVPALIRKRNVIELFEEYKSAHQEHSNLSMKPLSQRLFYSICNVLTSGVDSARTAIDDVVSVLVMDTMLSLNRLIGRVIPDNGIDWRSRIKVLESFLKYSFDSHISDASSCVTHNPVHGLSSPKENLELDLENTVSCSGCKYPFYIIDKLQTLAKPAIEDGAIGITEMLNDCKEKLKLFLGHRMRVKVQQVAIRAARDSLREECESTHATSAGLATIDYKMKWQIQNYREATTQHYGKRGTSWHGVMLEWFEWIDDEACYKVLFLDQIVSGDGTQDGLAVVGLLEAALHQIKKLTPVRAVTLLSDNAKAYQQPLILLLLPTLSARTGIRITRFLHTETQDSKSLLDAHFERCTELLLVYLNKGNDVVTAAQIVAGLLDRGGLANSHVCLVEVDRGKLKAIKNVVDTVSTAARKHFVRVSEAVLCVPNEPELVRCSSGVDSVKMVSEFEIKIFHNSGIGNGQSYKVNLSNGDFKPDYEAGNETNEDEDDTELNDDVSHHSGVFDTESCFGHDSEVDSDADKFNSYDVEAEDDGSVEAEDEPELVMSFTGTVIKTRTELVKDARKKLTSREVTRRVPSARLLPSKSIGAFAIRQLKQLESDPTWPFGNARQASDEDFNVVDESYTLGTEEFPQGWARRPRNGTVYGINFAKDFEEDILEMFNAGEGNSGLKKNPEEIIQSIVAKYPKRFAIPSTYHTKALITKIVAQKKASQTRKGQSSQGSGSSSSSKRGRKSAIAEEHFDWVRSFLSSNPNAKGNEVWKVYVEEHGEPDNNDASQPNKKWLQSFVGRLRSASHK